MKFFIEKWTDFGFAKRHVLEVLLTKFCLFHMQSFLLVNSVTNRDLVLSYYVSNPNFTLTVYIYDLYPKSNGLGSITTGCVMNFNE